jgi:hypothetical protein
MNLEPCGETLNTSLQGPGTMMDRDWAANLVLRPEISLKILTALPSPLSSPPAGRGWGEGAEVAPIAISGTLH